MIVPYRRGGLLPAASDDRHRRSRAATGRRGRSRRVLRPAPADGAAQAALGQPFAGHRACLRIARHHALAFRRAGLHGVGDAGREEHARRLAESLPAGVAAARNPLRGVARRPADAAVAAGDGAGAGHSAASTSSACATRGFARAIETSYAQSADRAPERGTATRCVRSDADAATGDRPGRIGRPRASNIRARRSARRCRRSRGSPRPTSASRSRSPNRATGIITSTREPTTVRLAARLDDLSRGLAALRGRPRRSHRRHGHRHDVGVRPRRVAENGNGGTDHGHGNAMMVIGGPVRGGRVYGTWPGLAPDSASRAAISRSRPTSATCSARSSPRISAPRRAPCPRSSPGTRHRGGRDHSRLDAHGGPVDVTGTRRSGPPLAGSL